MDALVEFSEVRLREPAPGLLQGFSIDAPRIGEGWRAPVSYSLSYAFDLRGWVLGRRVPVEAVEVLHEGRRLWHARPDVIRPDVGEAHPEAPDGERSGFFMSVSALSLPQRFELVVQALLEDGAAVELAELSGTRRALRSPFEARLRPLMVTTIGRTGSSMLVHLLGAHPLVVAYRPFRVEPRVSSYWIGVLRSLSEPASYRRQLQGLNLQDPTWWLGTSGRLARPTRDTELHDWLGSTAIETLAGFCQSRIEAVYTRIADSRGRAGALYFAEKYQPDGVPPLIWELYPDAREVVLVRDFRDMLCSMLAFNAKRGVQGFGRDRAGSDEQFVEQMGGPALALARSWAQRSERAHLVRYEDLVHEPARTLESLLDYVGVDSEGPTVEAMLAQLDEAEPDAARHRTTERAARSIGRWQSELGADLQRDCERAFGPALEAFGYPLGARSG